MKIKTKYLVILLLLIGAFLRFYNLNWGAPFYFHPDERNVIFLILKSSLTDPETLIHGTFAYGNFPVILTLLLKPLFSPVMQLFTITDPFAHTALTLRIISASSSVAMLYIIYLTGRFWSEKVGLLALFFATFSVGFTQQAHFGTFDGLVAFSAVVIFYLLLKCTKTKRLVFFYLSLIVVAAGTAAKFNLLILAVFPFTALLLAHLAKKTKWLPLIKHSLLGGIALMALTVLFSPNYVSQDFLNSLIYERGIVTGSQPVFYTQSFFDTTPVLFQFLHILPFLLNPVLTIAFILAFFYVLFRAIKTKDIASLLLVVFFLLLFLPQAFLHAKWTRYMVPPLPFVYVITSLGILSFLQHFKKVVSIKYLVVGIISVSSVLSGISYFITVFVQPDTRIQGARFARETIPADATILTEPYDIGITAFPHYTNSIQFNFYELDNNSAEFTEVALAAASQSAEYIILPSQRLLRSRLLNEERFPKGHAFYAKLLGGQLGYTKIYETPCDVFCKITYLGDPVYQLEETASVFDHPTVMIFKKAQ